MEREVEQEEERLASEAEERRAARRARTRRTLFRDRDGFLVPLLSLDARDVQALRRRGSLSDAEAELWLKARGARNPRLVH